MQVMIDVSKIRIKTNRLLLRAFKIDDLDDFYEYARVDGVGQLAGWLPHKSKEESMKILKDFITHKNTFAIEYQNKVIGSFGLEKYNEKYLKEFNDIPTIEFGFVLAKDYWNKGFMSEILKEMIAYIFTKTDVEMIVCEHFIDNPASKRVQLKAGFHPYKEVTLETRTNETKKSIVNILSKVEYR